MDANIYFHKEVIEKHEIEKILTPVNLGDGELANVGLSDLRKELDLCYQDIEKGTLKERFLGYIEDYTLNLRASLIPQKKNTLKFIKGESKKLTKQHPNLDYDNEDDEVVIEKINALTWKLEQEKFIFHYLKEQKIFLHTWVTQKWVEYKNTEKEIMQLNVKMKSILSKAKSSNQKVNKKIEKPPHFYCEIGALIAQDYIYRKTTGFDFVYYFKKKEFPNPNQLSKYVKEKVLNTKKFVSQYIDDTLKENDTSHNLYLHKTKRNNVIQYCKDFGITITNEKFL